MDIDKYRSSKVGDFFEVDGKVAYLYEEWTDVSSDNACFSEYGYETKTIVTDQNWSDYLREKSFREHQNEINQDYKEGYWRI